MATTDELRANLEHQRLVNAKHNRPASWLESFEKRVLRGELRDALAPLLVAGCWCFSTGEFRGPKDARIAGGRDYCPCEIGQAAKAAWLKEREMERAREWNAGVQQKVKAAGIPRRYEDCTLDSSPLNQTHPDLVAAMRYPSQPAEDPDDGSPEWQAFSASVERWEQSWFLWGEVGRGKTGLAVGLAKEICQRNDNYITPLSFVFRSVPDLLSELRSTYGRHEGPTETELIEKYATIPLLILDDLGAEQVTNTGWLEDRLYQIIGKRHAEERQTIFTSNLSLKAIAARIGERLTWRIVEMTGPDNIVEIKGSNLRDVKRHG